MPEVSPSNGSDSGEPGSTYSSSNSVCQSVGQNIQGRALYDFTAESQTELSLRAGDIISFISTVDSEWLQGTLDGKTGIFPTAFVKFIDELSTSDAVKLPSATVAYDFQAEVENEVNLLRGQRVYVISESNNEWARVRTESGSEGLCPTSFLNIDSRQATTGALTDLNGEYYACTTKYTIYIFRWCIPSVFHFTHCRISETFMYSPFHLNVACTRTYYIVKSFFYADSLFSVAALSQNYNSNLDTKSSNIKHQTEQNRSVNKPPKPASPPKPTYNKSPTTVSERSKSKPPRPPPSNQPSGRNSSPRRVSNDVIAAPPLRRSPDNTIAFSLPTGRSPPDDVYAALRNPYETRFDWKDEQ